jgi:hypothetical protein
MGPRSHSLPPLWARRAKKTRTKKIELSSNAQELEKARSEEETLFDSVEAMQWMANNTILRPLERVKGPRVEYDGPPESHDDQVVVVRVTTAAIYNFSGEEQVDIPNPRNIQQIVQAKHLSNDDKVEKIIGSKYVAETKTMVELAVWRLLVSTATFPDCALALRTSRMLTIKARRHCYSQARV